MNKMAWMFSLVLLFSYSVTLTAQEEQKTEKKEMKKEFGKAEFEAFHTVLRPLQHKALPAKNFKKIREKSELLVEKGETIVNLGIPKAIEKTAEYKRALQSFSDALAKYKNDAKSGTDAELKKSYLAVHDLYERLMNFLPD
jgi:hypothetical protein